MNMPTTWQDMEDQLLSELASHPTVEYIKQLEEDVKQYQVALQQERRKAIDMKTALDSYKRQTGATPTPIMAARE